MPESEYVGANCIRRPISSSRRAAPKEPKKVEAEMSDVPVPTSMRGYLAGHFATAGISDDGI